MCQSMEDRINAATAATATAKAIEFALKLIARGRQTLDEVKALAEKNRPAAT